MPCDETEAYSALDSRHPRERRGSIRNVEQDGSPHSRGGGRGPDRKDARLARFAWVPASAGMTILHQKRDRNFPGQQCANAGIHPKHRTKMDPRIREDDGERFGRSRSTSPKGGQLRVKLRSAVGETQIESRVRITSHESRAPNLESRIPNPESRVAITSPDSSPRRTRCVRGPGNSGSCRRRSPRDPRTRGQPGC